MAGIDLATAQARLDAYLAAEAKVLANQRVTIDGVEYTRANLEAIQKGIEIWNARVRDLSLRASGRGRSRTIVPV